MAKLILVSIDCSKIDKKRIKKTEKGQQFYNMTLIESPNGKFGNDFMVVEQVSKEERESGTKGTILGNAKYAGGGSSSSSGSSEPTQPSTHTNTDDMPF